MISSSPVTALIRFSSQDWPAGGSVAVTRRAPCSGASPKLFPSDCRLLTKAEASTFFSYSPKTPFKILTNVDLPVSEFEPQMNQSFFSLMLPVRAYPAMRCR